MIRDATRSMSNDLVSFLELVDGFVSRKRANVYKSTRKIGQVGCGKKPSAWNVSNGYGDAGKNKKEIVEKLRQRVDKINDGLSRINGNGEEDVEIEGYQYELIAEDDAMEEEEGNKVIGNPQNSGCVQPPKVKKKSVSFADDENVYKVFVKSTTKGATSCSAKDDRVIIEDCSDDDDDTSVLAADNEKEEVQAGDGRFVTWNCRNSVKPSVGWQEEDGSFVFSAPIPAKMESRADADI